MTISITSRQRKSQFNRPEDLAGSRENYPAVRGVGAIELHRYDV